MFINTLIHNIEKLSNSSLFSSFLFSFISFSFSLFFLSPKLNHIMQKLQTHLSENQERFLNIMRNDRVSKRMMFRNAERKLRKFQHEYNGDVKLGYTGGKYLQAVRVEGDLWYITIEDDYIKCVSTCLIMALSVEQMIRSYRKLKS